QAGPADNMQMPYSVGAVETIVAGESGAVADRRLHHAAKRSAVLGMDPAKRARDGRCFPTVGIQAKNPIVLVGPDQFAGMGIPAPASSVADTLPLGQECFAAPQVGVEPGVLKRNRRLCR